MANNGIEKKRKKNLLIYAHSYIPDTALTGQILRELTEGMDNVVFIPYQDKADLIYSLNAGDVHWCVNAKGIKGVSCPSKCLGLILRKNRMVKGGVLKT